MKTTNRFMMVLLLTVLSHSITAYTQTLSWVHTFGSASGDISNSIVTDAAGNSYTLGYFRGTVDFDPGPAVHNVTAVGATISILKLDPAGNFLWVKLVTPAGNSGDALSSDIKIDQAGNIYVLGDFSLTACDFDPGPAVFNLMPLGNRDIFVLKLDGNGNFIWVKQIGGTSGDFSWTLTLDTSSNIFVTGSYMGTPDFDPGAGVSNMTSAGGFDIFILKLNSSGNFVWVKSVGGTDSDEWSTLCISGSGEIYVSGRFRGTADFDPGAGTFNLTSAGSDDIFVLKLDASGNFLWAKRIGGIDSDVVNSMKLDPSGNLVISGWMNETVDFDPGPGVMNVISAGAADAFILKLDPSGNYIWVKTMGGTSGDGVSGSFIDNSGNIYLSGSFGGTCDFDPGIGVYQLTSAGSNDIFVAKLNGSGIFQWAKSMGGASSDDARGGIHPDISGNMFVTGSFQGTCDFNPDAGVFNLTSNGGYDQYTLKLTRDCVPTLSTISASNCTSYTVPSGHETYTVSGTYTDTIPNAAGCDSVITINLTIGDQIAPVATNSTLADVTAQCSVTSLTAPTATDNCAGTITGTHNVMLPISIPGTTVVTWTYNDGHGNTSTQTQNIIISDNTAPVANVSSLPNVTAQCSVTSLTAPTATDNCSGTITGTHNVTLPISTPGTTVVTWAYDDGHGNTSTQTQNVIINDNTAPVANTASLVDITAPCSVTSLTQPTATDNCAGTITGTHNVTLPITTPGTTVVTWTYDDGHGNTTTQLQNVIVTAPVATTTLSGLTISATTSGATYQWINCGNGNAPIAGATSQAFTATANGTYAVIVTQNGCSATSTCVTISTVGLDEISQTVFSVYPNPNNGIFKVVTEIPVTIRISNVAGQLILSQSLEAGEHTMELENAVSGMYFITATHPDGEITVQRMNIVQ